MTGPLILLTISIILFLIACYATFKTDDAYFIPAFVIVAISLISCILYPVKTVYEPITYKSESTSFKVFAITDKKVFESDKKIDFHNWTSGKEGYLRIQYDSFGNIITTYFTTEKQENEK